LSLPEAEEMGAWGCWPPGSRRGGRVEGDEIELTAEGSSGREGRRGHRVVDVGGGGLGVLEGRRPGRTGEGGGATAMSGGGAAPGGGSGSRESTCFC
jgi:hypothetical protein